MKSVRITLICVLILITLTLSNSVTAAKLQGDKKIIIDVPSRRLFLMENNQITKEYPVAVGKSYSQTPLGEYRVLNKLVDPYYRKKNIRGGSIYNPLGSRWIGFKPHYGVHGNSNPKSIGTFASAGCVRMFERDVQELYNQVDYNVPVTVKYELTKVKQDIDGEEPIVIVYPDYYSKVKNESSQIDENLKKTGLYDKIPNNRIKDLKYLSRKEKTIFSDTHTFFVNDMYITKDVIEENNQYYVNRAKVEKFFGIKFLDFFEGYAYYWGIKVDQKQIEDKKYISIEGLKELVGGKYKLNKSNKAINYTIENLVLLNDKIVRGSGKNLIETTTVPITSFQKSLGIEIVKSDSDTKLIYEGKELNYTRKHNNFYVSVNDLKEKMGIDSDIHTANKYINLYIEPTIMYKGVEYKGKAKDRNIYIPYSIIDNKEINEIGSVPAWNGRGNIEVTNIDGEEYVKLSDVESLEIRKSDFYNTIIYLQRRIF